MKKVVSILLMMAAAITVGQMATPREYLALMIVIGLVGVSIFAMLANRS